MNRLCDFTLSPTNPILIVSHDLWHADAPILDKRTIDGTRLAKSRFKGTIFEAQRQ